MPAKAAFLWFPARYIKKQKLFREGFALYYVWPLGSMSLTSEPPPPNVSFIR